MTDRPSTTRRRFLATAVGGTATAAALPVICGGGSFATAGELPVVNFPEHPEAIFAADTVEPLNASVDCGLRRARGAA